VFRAGQEKLMVTVTATISPVVTDMGEAVVPTVTAVDVKAPRT
jgi:hypothetical protein